MKTVSLFEHEYPVMAELEDGWVLFAIPAGPAIGKDFGEGNGWMCILESDNAEIPEAVRKSAVRAYRELSWPKLRADYFPQ